MREQVCIVLNEREGTKAKAAESLITQLKAADITASRIPVTEQLPQILKQRQPKVVVLDYLLGDYSTGLDILSALQNLEVEKRPRVIFLTDEPSIQVAVDALRGGAQHYIELDDPHAISKCVREVQVALENQKSPPLPHFSLPSLDDLILGSPAARSLEAALRTTAQKQAPIICITGKSGSGLTTTARALLGLQPVAPFYRIISMRSFCGELLDLAGLEPRRSEACLGNGLSMVIEHAEEEDGSLLEYISSNRESLWPDDAVGMTESLLIIVSSDPTVASAWQRLAQATTITVPSLAERIDDIPALVQRFVRRAEEFCDRRFKPFPSEVISWLASLAWPGEIKQLESVVTDAALAAANSEDTLKSQIEERRILWNELATVPSSSAIDSLEAASILEQCNFRYPIAAARLGCSVKQLRTLFRTPHQEGTP